MKKITSIILALLFLSQQSYTQINFFPDSGNVGIGTITPDEALHVKRAGSAFGLVQSESSNAYWVADIGGNNGGGLVIKNQGIHKAYVYYTVNSPSRFGIWVNGDNRLTINNDGRVGIGTIETGTHKLAVEGTIGSREVKVEPDDWSDFVFEDDYQLPPLEEVEQHIKEKGHLSEIPSEAEVAKDGINLGEMNAKLLQKVEELTLYLIEQNKEIKELKEKVQQLENG